MPATAYTAHKNYHYWWNVSTALTLLFALHALSRALSTQWIGICESRCPAVPCCRPLGGRTPSAARLANCLTVQSPNLFMASLFMFENWNKMSIFLHNDGFYRQMTPSKTCSWTTRICMPNFAAIRRTVSEKIGNRLQGNSQLLYRFKMTICETLNICNQLHVKTLAK